LAWTILPIVILVLIAIPSFKILYTQQDTSKPDITIKAIGKQWFWSYEYSDHGNISFDQMMVSKEDWEKGVKEKKIDPVVAPKLLAVDNEVVLPIGKKIKVNITAADVIHAWVVPSLGVKTDAVPGRMNAVWFRADKEGVFYGQCSELCGKDHAYMPIAVRIVSEEKFKEWLEVAKKKFASTTDERQFAAQTSK
jgi:cytochrome c oxidase subunit 2